MRAYSIRPFSVGTKCNDLGNFLRLDYDFDEVRSSPFMSSGGSLYWLALDLSMGGSASDSCQVGLVALGILEIDSSPSPGPTGLSLPEDAGHLVEKKIAPSQKRTSSASSAIGSEPAAAS